MPATTATRVNDGRAQPLFFVTAEANDNLLAAMDNDILPHVRELVAERVTVAFDHWAGFDVLTYRKGRYAPWPEEAFVEVEDLSSGAVYLLSERETHIGKNRFGIREVRRLCANGHQTLIVCRLSRSLPGCSHAGTRRTSFATCATSTRSTIFASTTSRRPIPSG